MLLNLLLSLVAVGDEALDLLYVFVESERCLTGAVVDAPLWSPGVVHSEPVARIGLQRAFCRELFLMSSRD